MPADKKALLDRMAMPKRAGEEDDMLAFSEEDMEASPEEAAPASNMDLSSVTDDELLAEAKKRGLVPDMEDESLAAGDESLESDEFGIEEA